jgi:hypothetical protein
VPEFTPEQLNTELNNTPTEVVVVPPAENAVVAADYVQCGFCKCNLTPKGHVYEISDTARAYSDANEEHRKQVKKLTEEISRLNNEVSIRDAKLREVTSVARKSSFI